MEDLFSHQVEDCYALTQQEDKRLQLICVYKPRMGSAFTEQVVSSKYYWITGDQWEAAYSYGHAHAHWALVLGESTFFIPPNQYNRLIGGGR